MIPGHLAGFECICCSKTFDPEFNDYICSRCCGNIDAVYDYSSIKKKFTVDVLKENNRKDVWRYAALFPFDSIKSVPPLDMPLSPLYRFRRLEKESGFDEIYVKDDTRMPSGSFKDRASSVIAAVALEKGIRTIACASTGNAGSSMACFGAACGIETIVYVPATAPRAKVAQLKVFGARVILVDGSYDDAYDLCVKDSEKHKYFNRCTGYNPFTREGKKSVSFEIWEQLGFRAPGSVFIPTGDGNIISGVWKGFRDLMAMGLIDKLPALYAVQSAGSDAVCRMVELAGKQSSSIKQISVQAKTVADSISVDTPRDGYAAARAVIETGGLAIRVDDGKIIQSIYRTASALGVFTEPAGAASIAGIFDIFQQGTAGEIPRPAVCLLTGNGLKDADAVL